MKKLIILGDGMSDHPVEALGGKTPLMVANKPHIDRIAKEGRTGLFRTIKPGQDLGSAVANLAVLGYDSEKVYNGRAVLEAASMGVELAANDVALRCNLIAIDDGKIKNHSAGHIETEEATELIMTLERELGGNKGDFPVTFHPGVSYRHLLVLRGGWANPAVACAPPHDHVGENIKDLMPSAKNGEAVETTKRINEIIEKASAILKDHKVNAERRSFGKDAADSIWVWSPGKRPKMPSFQEMYGVHGAVISAVDLIMGLGYYAGMDLIRVPGATGLEDTNYEGKARAAVEALKNHDLVYVHVEATDEAGHARDLEQKIRCIEHLDNRLTKIILEGIEREGIEATVAILPDHPTPVETGNHANDPVPVAIWTPGLEPDGVQGYDEQQVKEGTLGMLEGDAFIRTVIGN